MIQVIIYVQILSEYNYSKINWHAQILEQKEKNRHKTLTSLCLHIHEILEQIKWIDNNKITTVITKVDQELWGG